MPPAHPGAQPRVVLWGRPGCHLCDDAEAVVDAVCAEEGAVWVKRSILEDDERYAAYKELIPVLTVDDAVVSTWRVAPDELRAALRG